MGSGQVHFTILSRRRTLMKTSRLSKAAVSFLALGLVCGMQAGVANDNQGGHDEDHVIVKPANLKWGPPPPVLPPGAQLAILVGDPTKEGAAYTIRAKMPDGYKIPPHWHPSDENVTVIQGTLLVGRGEKFDLQKIEELPAGSYMRMPKNLRHFAAAKGETIIQVHGIGPFEFNYVSAADDPRKK
jgi:quercetin dioxygenase-like cupin family protein